jgi:hypothetical protein
LSTVWRQRSGAHFLNAKIKCAVISDQCAFIRLYVWFKNKWVNKYSLVYYLAYPVIAGEDLTHELMWLNACAGRRPQHGPNFMTDLQTEPVLRQQPGPWWLVKSLCWCLRGHSGPTQVKQASSLSAGSSPGFGPGSFVWKLSVLSTDLGPWPGWTGALHPLFLHWKDQSGQPGTADNEAKCTCGTGWNVLSKDMQGFEPGPVVWSSVCYQLMPAHSPLQHMRSFMHLLVYFLWHIK